MGGRHSILALKRDATADDSKVGTYSAAPRDATVVRRLRHRQGQRSRREEKTRLAGNGERATLDERAHANREDRISPESVYRG